MDLYVFVNASTKEVKFSTTKEASLEGFQIAGRTVISFYTDHTIGGEPIGTDPEDAHVDAPGITDVSDMTG